MIKIKRNKHTFQELINKNKKELLMDQKMLEMIEERIEKRHIQKAE